MIILTLAVALVTAAAASPAGGDYCGRESIPAYSPATAHESAHGQLVTVNAFFRHGMRSDFHKHGCFPNRQQTEYTCSLHSQFGVTPHSGTNLVKKFKSGCEIGQILDYAEVQMNRIGEYLVSAYGDHITGPDLYLRSTDTQRTLASLDLVLNVVGKKSNGEHLPVETDEFQYDSLNLNYQECGRANQINAAFTSVLESVGRTDSEFNECAARWKQEIGTDFSISESGDCLFAPHCAQVPLPDNIKPSDELFACVTGIYNKVRGLKYGYSKDVPEWADSGIEYCRLATGPFMRDLYGMMGHKSGLWATHDDTLACMLTQMGLWDGVWPKYGALVVFELYENGHVRVLRDGVEIGWKNSPGDIVPDIIVDPGKYAEECAREFDPNPTRWYHYLFRVLGVIAIIALVVSL